MTVFANRAVAYGELDSVQCRTKEQTKLIFVEISTRNGQKHVFSPNLARKCLIEIIAFGFKTTSILSSTFL